MTEGAVEDDDGATQLRARRLVQISTVAMIAMLCIAIIYGVRGNLSVTLALTTGTALMGWCRVLSRGGRVDLAGQILLGAMFVIVSWLMWIAQGLHDIAMLTYPVLLVMAGLLVHRKQFFVLLASMLVYIVFVTFSTEVWGWRDDGVQGGLWQTMVDTLVILTVSGFSVWVIINDLHRTLARLREQIVQFHKSQKHLTYLSQHDPLTGLPNRSMGRERIAQAINDAGRRRLSVALLFVDLDNFKAINDSLGHNVGDEFLKSVARQLQSAVRKSDIVARHGGDEFVIGLTDISDPQDVSNAAASILAALAQPFSAKDTEIATSCSIGVAMFPADGADYETLLRLSDIAMYQAKESGRNAFRFFDAGMNADIQENLLMVSQLRAALARREFVLYYQPVVRLTDQRLVGAEALVRWNHPQRGLVPPGIFIPAAEKSGLIVELGDWVLREACQQLVQWQQNGLQDFVMAVNLSPVQFRRGNVEQRIEEALRDTGVDPRCLELEITESTLIQDPDKFIVSLQSIKRLGVRLSIDDFGTGYSNLSYLQRFAVDKLKVDQSFVMRLQQGQQERAIVDAIVQMARGLNLTTHAEGIENAVVLEHLMALGCQLGQGYHFARPLPAQEFAERFLLAVN